MNVISRIPTPLLDSELCARSPASRPVLPRGERRPDLLSPGIRTRGAVARHGPSSAPWGRAEGLDGEPGGPPACRSATPGPSIAGEHEAARTGAPRPTAVGPSLRAGEAAVGPSLRAGEAAVGPSLRAGEAAVGPSLRAGEAAVGPSLRAGEAAVGPSLRAGEAAVGPSLRAGEAARFSFCREARRVWVSGLLEPRVETGVAGTDITAWGRPGEAPGLPGGESLDSWSVTRWRHLAVRRR
ncbi:unnamed protein product [Gadus morhua 'NCC']